MRRRPRAPLWLGIQSVASGPSSPTGKAASMRATSRQPASSLRRPRFPQRARRRGLGIANTSRPASETPRCLTGRRSVRCGDARRSRRPRGRDARKASAAERRVRDDRDPASRAAGSNRRSIPRSQGDRVPIARQRNLSRRYDCVASSICSTSKLLRLEGAFFLADFKNERPRGHASFRERARPLAMQHVQVRR